VGASVVEAAGASVEVGPAVENVDSAVVGTLVVPRGVGAGGLDVVAAACVVVGSAVVVHAHLGVRWYLAVPRMWTGSWVRARRLR